MDLPPQQSPPTPSPGPQKHRLLCWRSLHNPLPSQPLGTGMLRVPVRPFLPPQWARHRKESPGVPLSCRRGHAARSSRGALLGGMAPPREVMGMEAPPCWPQSGLDHGPDPFLVPWTDANIISGLGGPVLPPGQMGRKTPEWWAVKGMSLTRAHLGLCGH